MLIALIASIGLALTLRLVFYQIVDQGWLSAKAANGDGSSGVTPLRGLIEDASGNPLAISDELYAVYATPLQIPDKEWEAKKLSHPLHESTAIILHKLRGKLTYPELAAGISQSSLQAIQDMDLAGITYQAVPNRVYPEDSLASQVLGFVGSNGGQYGLEEEYNSLLSRQEKRATFIRWARDQHDQILVNRSENPQANPTGATLTLSLDTYMEDVIDRMLKSYMKHSKAKGGTIIISNPMTGRIVAMAGYPWFNPNKYDKSPVSRWTNPAVSDVYEPGSTFKIVTMSAGIDAHVIKPSTTIYDPGYITYPCDPYPIHNWDYPLPNGEETMTQVLQHSANVGASWVANRLGSRRFYRYVRRFGVGSLTGIDLQGETTGWVSLPGTSGWACSNLYDNSFGQALTVTPLQMLWAANAIGNGGWLMRPEVVKKISYRGVTVIQRPHRERRVMSESSSNTVTRMLTQSALGPPGQYGEASCALVPGYWMAAKTGTANVVSATTHRYLSGPGSTITSTLAYAPADHPRFSVLVVLRNPRSPWPYAEWGSQTAAPLVHKVFEALFLRYHVAPRAHNAARVLSSQRAFGGCTF